MSAPGRPHQVDAFTDQPLKVSAFVPGMGVPEGPVTGSLSAGRAQWLMGAGLEKPRFVAAQGAALGRAGRVHVHVHVHAQQAATEIWTGGDVAGCVSAKVAL